MSGLYLYCLVRNDLAPPRELRGLDDGPVRLHRGSELAAWVSPADSVPEPTLDRIRRHDAVVEAALAAGETPLPSRFGQWLPTPGALDTVLAQRAAAFTAALEGVAGAVEYALRVIDPELPEPGAEGAGDVTSGTAYMRSLLAREEARRALDARGREIATRVRCEAGNTVRLERIEPLRSRHGLVSIVHLVERSGQAEYRAAVAAAQRKYADLRLLLTGPWPPYSFAP